MPDSFVSGLPEKQRHLDHFAALAFAAMVGVTPDIVSDPQHDAAIARRAYQLAEAMLGARAEAMRRAREEATGPSHAPPGAK
jgi:hypothetical protein